MTLFSYILEKLATWMGIYLADLSLTTSADWTTISTQIQPYTGDIAINHIDNDSPLGWKSMSLHMNKTTGSVDVSNGDWVYFNLDGTQLLFKSDWSGVLTKDKYQDTSNFVSLYYASNVNKHLESVPLSTASSALEIDSSWVAGLGSMEWNNLSDEYSVYEYSKTGSPTWVKKLGGSSLNSISSAQIDNDKTAVLFVKKNSKPVIVAAVSPLQWSTSELNVDDYYVNQ